MNRSEDAQAFSVKINGSIWPVQLPPRAIASYLLQRPLHSA
jgi:hypothetical protein